MIECTWTGGTGRRHDPPVAATTAIDYGSGAKFPTGEPRYGRGCLPCAEYIKRYQATLGVEVTLLPIETVEYRELCPMCWGSHGCDLPVDHEPPHRCYHDEDEYVVPGPGVEVFHWNTDEVEAVDL